MRSVFCIFCAAFLVAGASCEALAQKLWYANQWGSAATPVSSAEPDDGFRQRWHEFWNEVELHRKRVNVWPDPFVIPDRELVRAPFRMMADNGWKLQTTLGDHFFQPEDNELTYAGELKLRWILTQIPPHRRRIYVKKGPNREATGARVASVYKHLAEISPQGIPCPVLVTQIAPRGTDGGYLNDVDQAYKSSLPAPRLPAASSDTGSADEGYSSDGT